jgi:hypothetical protein
VSYRARLLLRSLDDAQTAQERHPKLFARYARDGRSIVALSRALQTHKRAKKPAGGSRVDHDDVEPIDDPVWLETEARRREERFEKRWLSFDASRRSERAGMTALELHRLAAERAARLSTVAAGNIEPSRGGGDSAGVPAQQVLDDDPVWREHWRIIRSRLERVHEKLDEAEGIGRTAQSTRMLGVEKDRLILTQGVDLSNQAVVDLLGADIAGSAKTVERVRKAAGVNNRGHPIEDA